MGSEKVSRGLDWVWQQPLHQIPALLQILAAVRRWQRNKPAEYGVLPWEVQPWVLPGFAEPTIRRFMVMLWRAGLLVRIGGETSRRGYRLALQDAR